MLTTHTNAQVKNGYDFIHPLDSGDQYFMISKGSKTGIIDRNDKVIIPVNKEGQFIYLGSNRFLFYDRKTQEPTFIYPISGSPINVSEYYLQTGIGGMEKPIADKQIIVKNKKTSKFGIMRFDGSFVVKPTFDVLEPTPYSHYIFFKDNRSGFMDFAGKIILNCACEFISPYTQGAAICGKRVKNVTRRDYPSAQIVSDLSTRTNYAVQYSFMDKSGKLLSRNYFDWIGPFYDGFANVVKNHENFMIDKSGKKITVNKIYTLASYFNEGAAIIRKGQKLGLVNRAGKILAPPIYDEIETENLPLIPGSNVIVSFPKSNNHLEAIVAPKVFDGKVKAMRGESVVFIEF